MLGLVAGVVGTDRTDKIDLVDGVDGVDGWEARGAAGGVRVVVTREIDEFGARRVLRGRAWRV